MTGWPNAPEETVDVALLVEGTYPFVSGGVSSWVHQIVSRLDHLTFSVMFLGATRESYGAPRFAPPLNVKHLEVRYLLDEPGREAPEVRGGNPESFAASAELHRWFRDPQPPMPRAAFDRLTNDLGREGGLPRRDFQHSEASWQYIQERYRASCPDVPFVDYFWTVRAMHGALFELAKVAEHPPRARAYHAISTGYAGMLGAMLARATGRPLLLTEHGIYTKERKIDLEHAEWIRDAEESFGRLAPDDVGKLRALWIRFFEGLGRVTYACADPIVSLYEGNRQRQIEDGAAPERTRVIPNGTPIARYSPLRARRPETPAPIVGLLGRVVPIKDVRTFIRSMQRVCARIPAAEGWIIGPEDENPAYARECHELVEALGLSGRVKFLGFQRPDEVLPKLGALVLTSISEALPLVLLEAFASGLPAIATDVGSCRELIEGSTLEDRALGAAGAVVPIADPDATADAVVRLLTDGGAWRRAQAAAIARVEQYYDERTMFDRYRELYRAALERSEGDGRNRV